MVGFYCVYNVLFSGQFPAIPHDDSSLFIATCGHLPPQPQTDQKAQQSEYRTAIADICHRQLSTNNTTSPCAAADAKIEDT